jgi:hypothetical protein
MALQVHGTFNPDDELPSIRLQGVRKSACSKSLRPGRTAALAAERVSTHLMHGMRAYVQELTSRRGYENVYALGGF